MIDIKDILICPKCKAPLTEDLQCVSCKEQYSKYYGVYDVINSKLSDNQEILWDVSDDDILNDVKLSEYKSKRENLIKDYDANKNDETKIAIKKITDYTLD
ncbi:MAG: hypothetical protein RSE93_01215, partial [Oscillospiraceae bacterium]